MGDLLHDLRYAVRLLRKRPVFTLGIVLILALGTGANTAIFSLLNAVVLRPLPYAEPGRLYQLGGRNVFGSTWMSVPDFLSWQERTRAFESMAAARSLQFFVTQVDEPEQVYGFAATRELLPVLGVRPALGRGFAEDDYRPGAAQTAVITHRLWQRKYGSAPDIIGRYATLNGQTYQIIGVMPRDFFFPETSAQVCVPLNITPPLLRRQWRTSMVFARLKTGLTRRDALAETEQMGAALVNEFPKEHAGWRARITAIEEQLRPEARGTLLTLLGAVGFVLLIACLNVANMLLARAAERTKEMGIRVALGASRARLVRQLLTEAVLLALLGGALGLALAAWANRVLVAVFAQKAALPRLSETRLDAHVLAFTLLISVVAGLVFGLFPAWRVLRTGLNDTLKESSRAGSTGLYARHVRSLLVVAETALSLVLLAGAGLMMRSFVHLLQVDPGFQTRSVLTMHLPLPEYRLRDPKSHPLYYGSILSDVQSLPGVEMAALTTVVPLSHGATGVNFRPLGSPAVPPGQEEIVRSFRSVSPDYFRLLGIPLLLGRPFSEGDVEGAPLVVILNEAMARELWPGENAIGKQLDMDHPATVVGVARDSLHLGLASKPDPELYLPYRQFGQRLSSALVVRGRGDPASLTAAIRNKIRETRPDQPIADVRTLQQVVSDSVAQPWLYTALLGLFAGLAVLLAAVGIYAVVSQAVIQRQKEIGIRVALGAEPANVFSLVLLQGLPWVAAGIVLGLAGALAATRLISNLLFQVKPYDPLVFAGASLLLLLVAFGAMLFPARRALGLDPLAMLRHE